MAEAAVGGAPSGGTPASGAASGSQQGVQGAQAQAGKDSGGGKPSGAQAPRAPETATAKAGGPPPEGVTAEEFEEIRLGHATAKVPKEFAKVVKDVERFAHSQAQRAAQQDKWFQDMAAQAKSNPALADQILAKFGIDPDQHSQARLADRLKREMMTEEQRRMSELEEENRRYKETEKQRADRESQEKAQREHEAKVKEVRVAASKALEADDLVRDDPFLVARVIATKAQADKQRLNWTWEDCVSKVGRDFRAVIRSKASTLSPEQLEEHFGADALKKWREFDVKRVTDSSPSRGSFSKQSSTGDQPATSSTSSNGKRPLNEKEYQEYFRRLADG